MKGIKSHLVGWTFLTLLLGGCLGAGHPSLDHDEHLYIDARLGFAMEYPVSWSRARSGSNAATVRWVASGKRGEVPAGAAVTSLPGEPFPDAEQLLERYRSEQPEVRVSASTARQLPAGHALQVLADAPDRRTLLYFLTAAGHAFILEFSAPPDEFPDLLPLFEEMAESFTPLAR